MPLPMLACYNQALRSYQLEGTRFAVIHHFCCMSPASFCAERDKGSLNINEHTVSCNLKKYARARMTCEVMIVPNTNG